MVATIPRNNPFNEVRRLMAEAKASSSWHPVDLAEIGEDYKGPTTDVCTRTDGLPLFYLRKLNAINAEPETGKTWLAALAVTEVISANLIAVVFDFEEDAATWKDRLRRIGASEDSMVRCLRYVRPEEPLSAQELATLEAEVLPGALLVVIDAVTSAMGLDGLDPISTGDTASWLLKLPAAGVRAGAAVVMLDHVTKSRENRGRWAIGSQAKLAQVSGVAYSLELRQPIAPGRVGRATILIAKDRHGAVRGAGPDPKIAGEFVVDATGDEFEVRIEPPLSLGRSADLSFRAELVLKVLPDEEADALGRQAIGDALARIGHPLKKSTVNYACAELVLAGLATELTIDDRGTRVYWRQS